MGLGLGSGLGYLLAGKVALRVLLSPAFRVRVRVRVRARVRVRVRVKRLGLPRVRESVVQPVGDQVLRRGHTRRCAN